MWRMRTPIHTIALTAALCTALAVAVAARARQDASIPFPAGYRTWAHVKSVVVGPTSAAFATEGGIHHIYANQQALEGYRTGKFPDGSVIVYDLLETKEVNGNVLEAAPRRLDVMSRGLRRCGADE